MHDTRRICLFSLLSAVFTTGWLAVAAASTYVVYIPLDDPIYDELGTLNALGYLDTYLEEIRPISRVEAARLTLEAERNEAEHNETESVEPLATSLVHDLRAELSEEISWIEKNQLDDLPTIVRPIERLEAQYIYSLGPQRKWITGQVGTPNDQGLVAKEDTPLLPNNDGLPTAAGSNEILRASAWGGAGSFLTAYGEGALAGPLSHQIQGVSPLQPVDAAVVADFGNVAVSFGMEQMWWGTGTFNALTQSNNASPFPAIRVRKIHPTLLPWIFRYLGQFQFEGFFGQFDDYRYYWHPYIDGEIFAFKPLPTFEFGLTHTIIFGGRHNNNYNLSGFIGRATGFATGSPASGNTHSRGGIYLKFYFPHWRNAELYQEMLGQDNLTNEVAGIGRFLPFLSVSYQGGFYLPRLTRDGRTDLRFEYLITEPNYSGHGGPLYGGDSLYWSYEEQLVGAALGPNGTEIDIALGRWLDLKRKLTMDVFYTEEAPNFDTNEYYPAEFYPYPLAKEHSAGVAVDLMTLPLMLPGFGRALGLLGSHVRIATEYARDFNYQSQDHTLRFLVSLSGSLQPTYPSWEWNRSKPEPP